LKSKAHLITDVRKRKNLTHLQSVLLFKDSSGVVIVPMQTGLLLSLIDLDKFREPRTLMNILSPSEPQLLQPLQRQRPALVLVAALLLSSPAFGRNVIIFVADGLRNGSVSQADAPTLYALRQLGVNFQNSHAVFPTFTTPNAAAIATGHYLGDTGDFSNTLFVGFPIPQRNGIQVANTVTPFIENDAVLGCVDEHFLCNFLNEETLLAVAHKSGFATAAIGKLGPTLIQDIAAGCAKDGSIALPDTVIIDDMTGKEGGVPLDPKIASELKDAGLDLIAPDRSNGRPKTQEDNGSPGNSDKPGTLMPNLKQQQFFADALTKAILPGFLKSGKSFVVVFWSRDPDGTQHNQGDSLNSLRPGINGPTSIASIKNADANLKQIVDFVSNTPGLAAETDLFVTSDHGFSTIGKYELDADGKQIVNSYAASQTYKDGSERREVPAGFLPPGFVAIDLAHFLNLPLFDPDKIITVDGQKSYKRVNPEAPNSEASEQRPASGDGLIGGTGALAPADVKVVVAANGGSDLVYLPSKDSELLEKIVGFLSAQDYVSGLFTDPDYGPIKGALTLDDINLKGLALLPTPALVINFRSFATETANPLMNAVTLCDTTLQQGQGMHGSFSRADTFNCMIAVGPDFKQHFLDLAPVSNVDLAKTFARILKLELPLRGRLEGRILNEALKGGPDNVAFETKSIKSEPAGNGQVTKLNYQLVGKTKYFDAAGFPARSVGLDDYRP
jgi:arylsulfatase A-like enzyme